MDSNRRAVLDAATICGRAAPRRLHGRPVDAAAVKSGSPPLTHARPRQAAQWPASGGARAGPGERESRRLTPFCFFDWPRCARRCCVLCLCVCAAPLCGSSHSALAASAGCDSQLLPHVPQEPQHPELHRAGQRARASLRVRQTSGAIISNLPSPPHPHTSPSLCAPHCVVRLPCAAAVCVVRRILRMLCCIRVAVRCSPI